MGRIGTFDLLGTGIAAVGSCGLSGLGSIFGSGSLRGFSLLFFSSKVPKLFESNWATLVPFIPSQRRGSKSSSSAILLVFLTLETFLKKSGLKFDNWLFGSEKFSGLSTKRPLLRVFFIRELSSRQIKNETYFVLVSQTCVM